MRVYKSLKRFLNLVLTFTLALIQTKSYSQQPGGINCSAQNNEALSHLIKDSVEVIKKRVEKENHPGKVYGENFIRRNRYITGMERI